MRSTHGRFLKSLFAFACLLASAHYAAGQGTPLSSITIHADRVLHRVSPFLTGACLEDVNHEVYGGIDSQMIFGESFAEPARNDASSEGVSGMWRATRSGTANGACQLVASDTFSGRQSQQLTFSSGSGTFGIENQGLHRQGLHLSAGNNYEGFLCVRAERPTELWVALESNDGQRIHAQRRLRVTGAAWQKLPFTLKPKQNDAAGRFTIRLHRPGSVTVGYAFLQPGPWGRFKNLPVRRDVAEGLLQQGVTVLRQGGCMVNASEYRWKKMIGPRELRPPYAGWWYPYSSNGWGILDFLNFCEAAGILGIPDFNMGETPQDLADFVEYVNGPVNSTWGQRRAQDGHPAPYHLQHLQLGNEERVNEDYWTKFKPIAEAIWAQDPQIILVVGDFAYGNQITDPLHLTGAAGQITTLAAQQKILQLAKQHQREVWFDVHINTEGPRPDFGGTLSYVDALAQLADGAKHRVVIFEFNAGNHSQRRALANAAAIQAIARDGRIPIACSANCLQPDAQNDNGWDQGLLFLNPGQVWLQPPGYVTQIYARQYQPLLVASEQAGAATALDVAVQRSEDGRVLVLQVVNPTEAPIAADLLLHGLRPQQAWAQITELSGPWTAANTADQPHKITPVKKLWSHHLPGGESSYVFPASSITSMRFD